MSELLRHILDAIESQRRTFEALRPQLEAQRALRQHLEAFQNRFDLSEAVRRSLEALQPPFEAQQAFRQHLDTIQNGIDMINARARVLEALQPQLEAQQALRQHLEAFQNQFDLSEVVRRSLEPLTNFAIAKIGISNLWHAINQTNPIGAFANCITTIDAQLLNRLYIQPDGSLALDGDTVTLTEVEETVSDFLERPEQYLDNLQSILARLRKPLQEIIKLLLSAVIGALLQIILTPYLDQSMERGFRQLQDEIHKEGTHTRRELRRALKQQKHLDLFEWRMVTGTGLDVKIYRSTKASVRERLEFGTIVRVINKHREWTLIEYISPDTETLAQGWVYNKYLKRIH
jgi:hypothetical protein